MSLASTTAVWQIAPWRHTKGDEDMKTMLAAAFLMLALPAYAATTNKFSPPSVSKQQEQAYNQTYQSEMAQEKLLKAGGKTR
jgi:hypothetical protein